MAQNRSEFGIAGKGAIALKIGCSNQSRGGGGALVDSQTKSDASSYSAYYTDRFCRSTRFRVICGKFLSN